VKAAVKNESVRVPEAASAPTIDGKLDDACWEGAARVEGFCDMFNNTDLRAQTFLRLVRDKNMLYIGIRAPLEGAEFKRTLPAGSKDGWVWEDESCEVFFLQGKKMHQFLLGPGDIYADNLEPDVEQKFSMDVFRWDCKGVRYVTHVGEKEWTGEMAIPLDSLELKAPTKAEPWKVNFCRNHYYRLPGEKNWQCELSSWRPTLGSFHNIERFGVLYFE
jgi:hypothetical protein